MKIGVATILILLMTACVTSREVYTSEGQQGHSIDCSGGGLDWGKCYEKAGDLCREKGYEVLETSGEKRGITDNQPRPSRYSAWSDYAKTNRSMVIKCNR